jgi:hypothetical protein
LVVHAYQADDDFYIDVEGGGLKTESVWADSGTFGRRSRILVFETRQAVSKGTEVALAVVRDRTPKPGFGSGVIRVENEARELNCYVRYGVGEDEYDEISQKPFPAIPAPVGE